MGPRSKAAAVSQLAELGATTALELVHQQKVVLRQVVPGRVAAVASMSAQRLCRNYQCP